MPLAQADRRVLVTRTFSKIFGMAGLRVGYAIGHPDTLDALRREGSSGTLSNASLAAAAAALADHGHLAAEQARNAPRAASRARRFEAAGYRVLPSSANFVMIDIRRDAGAFGGLCRQHRIVVARPFPPLTTCVRLTIGTQAEMEEAVPAMLALLEAPASARIERRAYGIASAELRLVTVLTAPDAAPGSGARAFDARASRAYSPARPLVRAFRHVWLPVVTPLGDRRRFRLRLSEGAHICLATASGGWSFLPCSGCCRPQPRRPAR